MNICSACGAKVNENDRNCEYCGSPLMVESKVGNNLQNNINSSINNNTSNNYNVNNNYNYNTNNNTQQQSYVSSNGFDPRDIQSNKVMAVLCYIIPLIPYLAEKNSKWVRFHAIQGMNLWLLSLIIYIPLTIIATIIAFIPYVGWLVSITLSLLMFALSIGVLVLDIMGIVNVCKSQAKELPVINKFKIIKK